VIGGDPLRQVTEAEEKAESGDIVLSTEATAVVYPTPLVPSPLPQPDWSSIENVQLVESALHRYLPSTILSWLEIGLTDWLGVLRPMTVTFVGIGELDYTKGGLIYAKPKSEKLLHKFVKSAQSIIYRYEGIINKVAVDDKGTDQSDQG